MTSIKFGERYFDAKSIRKDEAHDVEELFFREEGH